MSIKFPLYAAFFTISLLGSGFAQAGATVSLSAEASRPATNDTVDAMVYAEMSGRDPAELAQRMNREIAEALKQLRSQPEITVKSGQQSSYPVYASDRKIDSWRMRSELLLSSGDVAAVSNMVGRLQQRKLLLGGISQRPSAATRKQIEELATRDALAAFSQRAGVIASALGRSWKIKQLSVNQQGGAMPMFRAASVMMADAAPAPIEAGESDVTIVVSGEIELSE